MSVEKWMARLGRFIVPRMNFAAAPYGVSGPCCLDSQFGKLDGDLVSGSTATVSVWTDGVDSGDNIEGVKLPPWATSGKLPSGDWVTIEKIDGDWYARFDREQRFELKTALTPGGSATAHPLNDDGSVDTTAAYEFTVYDFHGIYRGRARNAYSSPHNRGSRGKARYHTDSGQWEITQLEPHALLIQGEATADWTTETFTIDGVTVLNPIGGIITNTDPAGNVTVTDTFGLHGSENNKVIAAWDENEDKYKVTQLPSGLIKRFELKDALAPGGNATAHPLSDDGTVDTTAANEFEVYDFHGIYRGRARNAYSSPHNRGSRGYARYVADSEHWEIYQLEPHALMIQGSATADWTASTFTIDGVIVLNPVGGIITNTDPAGNVTVTDAFDWDGSDNDVVIAVWDESSDTYKAIQVTCPS